MNINETTALVAGGASGLGRATAEALQSKGAKVMVLDLPAAEDSVPASSGLAFCAADVRDGDQVAAAVDAAAELGELRICVNCAGIGAPGRIARKGVPMELETFRNVIEVNLIGTFNVARLAAGADAGQRPGRRRARRDRQHRLRRRLRGPDRPGALLGVQGRDRRHEPADRPRPLRFADPLRHDRPGDLRHPAAGQAAGGRPRLARHARCRTRRASGCRPSTPTWWSTSSRTRCSTAR